MKLIEFPEQNVVYAKDQPEYLPLPAMRTPGVDGELICCWQLSWRERVRVLFTGRIWHSILTFGKPLQPQLLQCDTPEAIEQARGEA